MTEIRVGSDEPFEIALKRFNRRVAADGILGDARRHRFYEKPSERRNRKRRAAELKRLRAIRRSEQRRHR